MKLQRKKKLGQLLCEKSYLDETNLEFALAEQKLEHRRLGQILLELGYITQAQLNEALALQVGIERIDLTDVSISNEILSLRKETLQIIQRIINHQQLIINYWLWR
jgi:type IV pilus assembly protein PilB